ncbi:carbohydrate-binding module family 1 protein [Ramaria rubella]|nr:carbohydrate-binding module family 1 protein [Ramaria rubella]
MHFLRCSAVMAGLCSVIGLVAGQSSTQICDSLNGICFQGYQDTELDIFVGVVLPPLTTPPSSEFITQIVAPNTYGYTGVSMAGTMADSLLFVLWPNGDDVVFSTRWTDAYVQPLPYSGPTITMLPGSGVNSTHIKATFRCQDCITWTDGSFDPTGSFQLLAYVASTTVPVNDPSNPNSNFTEHDQFDFFGLVTPNAVSSNYSTYLSEGSSSSAPQPTAAPSPSSPSSSPVPPSSTSSASAAEQTKYGQCGGQGWAGPTACVTGSTCVAVSPPYYSQCQ